MNALYALDANHVGQGVTVAVIDDGVVNVNGELDGRLDLALSKDFGYVTTGGVRTKRDEIGDAQSDHGTAVANVIAAAANGKGSVGFAPGAVIASLRATDWDADTKTEVIPHLDAALSYAADKGFKVVSSSLIGGGPGWSAAVARIGAAGGILVNSAGNFGGADPYDGRLVTAASRDSVIFVGAYKPALLTAQAGMEEYSNRAGAMKDRFVVAIGTNVTTDVAGNWTVFGGTSSAAPVVSALVADILSKWPQLTGRQAGDVVLTTAKDLGTPGVDEIYGHGLVDFQAALAPVDPTLSNGTSQTAVQTSVMSVPAAMGAGGIQTALSNVTILDGFGRDYSASLAGMVVKPQVGEDRRIERRISQMGRQTQMAFGGFSGTVGYASTRFGPGADQVATEATAGSFGFVGGGIGLRAAWNASDSLQSDTMGLAAFSDGVLAYAPQADTSMGVDRYLANGKASLTISSGREFGSAAKAVTLGWSTRSTDVRVSFIDETGTVMGVPTGLGALRLGRGARTLMIEAHRTVEVAFGWTLEGYGSLGVTRLKIDAASLVTGSTPILGSRIGLQVNGSALGGMVSFGVAQPLMIEAGAARLTYGNGYDLASRSLTYGTTTASLAGQRRMQLTAGYSTGGVRSAFRLGLMQDLSRSATSALASWSLRY